MIMIVVNDAIKTMLEKNIVKYFTPLQHKKFSLSLSKFDSYMKREVHSYDFGCPV